MAGWADQFGPAAGVMGSGIQPDAGAQPNAPQPPMPQAPAGLNQAQTLKFGDKYAEGVATNDVLARDKALGSVQFVKKGLDAMDLIRQSPEQIWGVDSGLANTVDRGMYRAAQVATLGHEPQLAAALGSAGIGSGKSLGSNLAWYQRMQGVFDDAAIPKIQELYGSQQAGAARGAARLPQDITNAVFHSMGGLDMPDKQTALDRFGDGMQSSWDNIGYALKNNLIRPAELPFTATTPQQAYKLGRGAYYFVPGEKDPGKQWGRNPTSQDDFDKYFKGKI